MQQRIALHGNADAPAARRPGLRGLRSVLVAAAASGAMATTAQVPGTGQDVSLRSFVRFNTVCLTCHEAQCSGRLSFDSAGDAKSHILRYTGRPTDAEIQEMFVMLKYMKEQCGYYPLPGLPGSRRWTVAEVGGLRGEDERSYFLPLGALAERDYELRLRFEAETSGTVRITSAAFDEVVNETMRTEQDEVVVRLRPTKAAAHYLHLHLDDSVLLLELNVASPAAGTP